MPDTYGYSVDEARARATLDAIFDGPVAFLGMVWQSVEPVIWPMVLGGLPLGLVCGGVCYFVVRITVQQFRSRRKLRQVPAE